MSKLVENKQLIHIATEIVVIFGITFYLTSKNRKLLEHIEDLSQRLEEQEDLIQKHDQIIKQLVQVINNIPVNQPKPVSDVKEIPESKKNLKQHIPRKVKFTPRQPDLKEQERKERKEVIEEESESDKESDLDREIAEELADLQNDKQGLKKRLLR